MRILFGSLIAVVLMAASGAAQAKDGFESVQCTSDVRSALIGKKMNDDSIVQLEQRNARIGLKGLGGDEVSDDLNSVSWKICGKEYFVVVGTDNIVRDVLAFPAHSRRAPQFTSAGCQVNGKPDSRMIVGVLDNAATPKEAAHVTTPDKTLLPATAAWRIDEKTGKLSAVPVAGLKCPRSDIITADGGL
jgi:hypothetical protein